MTQLTQGDLKSHVQHLVLSYTTGAGAVHRLTEGLCAPLFLWVDAEGCYGLMAGLVNSCVEKAMGKEGYAIISVSHMCVATTAALSDLAHPQFRQAVLTVPFLQPHLASSP
jgi:hypothetical protein